MMFWAAPRLTDVLILQTRRESGETVVITSVVTHASVCINRSDFTHNSIDLLQLRTRTYPPTRCSSSTPNVRRFLDQEKERYIMSIYNIVVSTFI